MTSLGFARSSGSLHYSPFSARQLCLPWKVADCLCASAAQPVEGTSAFAERDRETNGIRIRRRISETGHALVPILLRDCERTHTYTYTHAPSHRLSRAPTFVHSLFSQGFHLVIVSLVAGLYKFRPAILCVLLRPRDESLERDYRALIARPIA